MSEQNNLPQNADTSPTENSGIPSSHQPDATAQPQIPVAQPISEAQQAPIQPQPPQYIPQQYPPQGAQPPFQPPVYPQGIPQTPTPPYQQPYTSAPPHQQPAQMQPPFAAPQQAMPQQQYIPSPAFAGAHAPNPKHGSKAVVIFLLVIVVLLASCITAFAFREKIMLHINPESYLLNSLQKTVIELVDAESSLPQTVKFAGKPLSHNFEFKIDNTDHLYTSAMDNTSIAVNVRTDWENSHFRLGTTIRSTFLTLNDNEIYISPKIIALSIPTYFMDYGFISVNTETLIEDWNNSEFAKLSYTTIPDDLDIADLLETFFQTMREADEARKTPISKRFAKDIESSTKQLIAAMSIEHKGDERIDGAKYEHFVCIIPADDVKDYLYNSIEVFYSNYKENSTLLDMPSPYYDDTLDEMLEFIDGLEFTEDIYVEFYVDNGGFIRFIDIPKLEYELPSYYGETYDKYETSASVKLLGKSSLLDDFSLAITHKEIDYNDVYKVTITRTNSDEANIVNTRWKLDFSNEYSGYKDSGRVTLDFNWDKKAQTSDNMKFTAKFDDEYSTVSATLTGNLVDSDEFIQLSDAQLQLLEDSDEFFSFSFDYKCQPVLESDVSLEGETVTDFFSLSMRDLEEIAGPLAMLSAR